MMVIGVTGGTGSGKSTVSKLLSGFGGKVVDADLIAREVVKKGEKAYAEIVQSFGKGILDGGGQLDRKKLSGIVFSNSDKLELLNRITHKYITEKIIKEVASAKEEEEADFLVLDVPIPVEHGFLDLADTVWVVSSTPGLRIKRIMDREGISRSEALKRIESQYSDEEYRRIADVVIENNSGLEELKSRVTELYNRIIKGDAFAENSCEET